MYLTKISPSALSTVGLLFALGAGACGTSSGDAPSSDASAARDSLAALDTSATLDTGALHDTQGAPDTGATPDSTTALDAASDTSQPDGADPNDPCDRQFTDHIAYLTELSLAGDGGDDDGCCFDFTDDSVLDNKLGAVVRMIESLPQITSTTNAAIADNIADGTFTVLFEFTELDSLVSDGDVTLNGFYGEDTDDDHANNLNGSGTFTVNLSSFVPGSADPRIHFDGVTITNGHLRAGPSVFHLEIPLMNGLEIAADIKDARLDALVSEGPHGGVMIEGTDPRGAKLGGVIAQDELFGALNDFVRSSCTCLDTGGTTPLIKEGETWSCGPMDKSGCDVNDSTERMCGVLADSCGLALALVTPDIDTNESGSPDAFSLGFWFKATGGQILGVEPASCQP